MCYFGKSEWFMSHDELHNKYLKGFEWKISYSVDVEISLRF